MNEADVLGLVKFVSACLKYCDRLICFALVLPLGLSVTYIAFLCFSITCSCAANESLFERHGVPALSVCSCDIGLAQSRLQVRVEEQHTCPNIKAFHRRLRWEKDHAAAQPQFVVRAVKREQELSDDPGTLTANGYRFMTSHSPHPFTSAAWLHSLAAACPHPRVFENCPRPACHYFPHSLAESLAAAVAGPQCPLPPPAALWSLTK
eukprot:1136338-Pelagomonas_calceolata.AAC.11